MVDLQVNGITPSDVRKNGTSVSDVRKNGTIVWPPEVNLDTENSNLNTHGWEYSSTGASRGSTGHATWKTSLIPKSQRDNFAYINRVDVTFDMWGNNDDNGTAFSHRTGLRFYWATDSPSIGGSSLNLTLSNLQKHGTFRDNDTFTAPEGRVIVGFQWQSYFLSRGDDDNIGAVEEYIRWYVYTCEVKGYNKNYKLVHNSSLQNNTNSNYRNNFIDNGIWSENTVTSPTLRGSNYLTGMLMKVTSVNNNDDNFQIGTTVKNRNYYREGKIKI